MRLSHLHGKTIGRKSIQFVAGRDMRFLLQFHQFTDTMRRDGTGQERRNDGQYTLERARQGRTLLHEQSHGTIGNGVRPQQIQAIEEGQELHHHTHYRHVDIGLDGEQIEIQADVPEFPLPPTELTAVLIGNPERLDGIKVVESLHLKGHHLATHFPHLLAVLPLLLDDETGDQQDERCTGKGNPSHGGIVMENHEKAGEELVQGNHDGRQPTDGIAAHRTDITGKAVQYIPVGILIDCHVIRIDNLVEDIRLNIVVDIDVQFRSDAADEAAEHQAEHRATHHDAHHDPQLAALVTRNDINHVFPGNTTHQSHGGTENPQYQIKSNGSLVAQAIRKDPPPVIQNLLQSPFPPFTDENVQ